MAVVLVLVAAAACSTSTEQAGPGTTGPGTTAASTTTAPRPTGTGGPTSTTTTRPEPPAAPVNYSRRGPYSVGFTELSLGDRTLRVFYPATAEGLERFEHLTSYHPGDAYPPEVAALLAAAVPPLVADLPLDAYRDAPVNDEGPFPVILHSHGAGGSNLYSSEHFQHEASWGFVVAAPDHRSRNETAQMTNQWGGSPTDLEDLANSLTALVAANAAPSSVLLGGLDTQQVGVEGHSAGGAATYQFATTEPRVKVWIGLAPAPAYAPITGTPPLGRPAMIVAGDSDSLVLLPVAQAQYDALGVPKRMVTVKGGGHTTFLDRCKAIFDAGGLAQFVAGNPALGAVAQDGDGCTPGNVDPVVAGELINHVMIAQYRIAFGLDHTDVSLDPAYLARTFPVAFGSEQADPAQANTAPEPRGASTTAPPPSLSPETVTTAAPTP